jgi:hypothetical protein
LLALPVFGGCVGEVFEQAQNAAVRQQSMAELKQFSEAFFKHHDTHRRAPKDWQELATFAPGGLQQSLESKGYTIVWGVSFPEMKAGTSQFPLVHPSDAATNGGLVLMADGSTQVLTAEEFNQKVRDHETYSNPASNAAQVAATPAGNPAVAQSGSPAASTASPETHPFKVGDKAYAQWAGEWEPIEILELIPEGGYKVRWTNWGPEFDGMVQGAPVLKEPPPGAKVSVKRSGPPPSAEHVSPTRGGRFGQGQGSEPGVAIDASTPLAAGDKIYAQWVGNWVPAEVVSLVGTVAVTVRIEQDGAPFSPTLPRQFIRLQNAANATARTPPTAANTALRTWTDTSGKFRMEATFVSVTDGQVLLERPDGARIRLPLDKLSPADQQFINEQQSP